jgi:hypothetical protein
MDLNAELREAAEALATALRVGRIARVVRPAARAALAEAFAASEQGRADLALVRRLDALAFPFVPRIPAPPRLRPLKMRGALDHRLLRRLSEPEALADRRIQRLDRFLAVTGAEPMSTVLRAPRQGDPDPLDMDLPDG